MCNAMYHSSECRCGFGGEGHLGRSPGGLVTHSRPLGRFSWPDQYLDTCRPTKCPRCGDSVFFVRHNGGSVWFDELGPPWPKHGCFDEYRDEGRYGIQLRRLLTTPDRVFGVIIETETTRPGEGGRIKIRCFDDSIIDEEFNMRDDL